MNWKKGKTLANELLDDLLDDEKTFIRKTSSAKGDQDANHNSSSEENSGEGGEYYLDVDDGDLEDLKEVSDSSVAEETGSAYIGHEVSASDIEDIEADSVRVDSLPDMNLAQTARRPDQASEDSSGEKQKKDQAKDHEKAVVVDDSKKESVVTSPFDESDDHTMVVDQSKPPTTKHDIVETMTMPNISRQGRVPSRGVGGAGIADASLSQSEALRIAQEKITDLDREIERLREENESLAAAGEAITRRTDELMARLDHIESQKLMNEERAAEEKQTLIDALAAKDKDLEALRLKEEEFEVRLSSNLKKIRVRERELENRLELAKMEGAALLRSKDEIILDMKRQLDQGLQEIENFRSKGQDLTRQLSDKQEMLRRTVKALRIALSMLEGELDSSSVKKGRAS